MPTYAVCAGGRPTFRLSEGGKRPGGKMSGGICPGICPGGNVLHSVALMAVSM